MRAAVVEESNGSNLALMRTNSVAATSRSVPLDAVRAVAAAMVVITHVSYSSTGNRGTFGQIFARMDAGVSVFFVLSGYLLYQKFIRHIHDDETIESIPRFWWRRFLRIMPLYWLVLVVVVFGYSGDTAPSQRNLLRWLTFSYVKDASTFTAPMTQAWTLAVELAFYALLPVFAVVVRTAVRRVVPSRSYLVHWLALCALVVVALVFRWRASSTPDASVMLGWFPNHLDTFAAGMGLALVQHRWQPSQRIARFIVGGSLVACVVAVMTVSYGVGLSSLQFSFDRPHTFVRHGLYLVIGLTMVSAGAFWRRSGSAHPAAARLAITGGALSYPIYLVHLLVLGRYLDRHDQQIYTLSFPKSLVFTALVSTALAWLLHRYVERPLLAIAKWSPARWLQFRPLLGLCALAGGIWRLWTLLTINSVNPSGGDPFYYHVQANLLAAGKGFAEPFRWVSESLVEPTAIHPPLFSMYLAGGSLLGAHSYLAHKLLAVVAGTAVIWVVGLIGRRIGGNACGLIAAAGAAIYPQFWSVDGTLWAEGLYTLCIGLVILRAMKYREQPSWTSAGWFGLSVCAAALTRGEAVLLIPLLMVPVFVPWRQRRSVAAYRYLAVGVACAVLPMSVWIARNLTTFERPVLISTNSDEVLFYANCPDVYYGDLLGYWSFNCQQDVRRTVEEPREESVRVRFWRDRGIDYALDHTDRWPAVVTARFGRVLDVYRPQQAVELLAIEGRNKSASRLGQLMWWMMLVPAAYGVVLARRKKIWLVPLVANFAVVGLTTILVYGHPRFRSPVDLAVVLLCGLSGSQLWQWHRRSWVGPIPGGTRAGTPPEHRLTSPPHQRSQRGRRVWQSTVALWGLAIVMIGAPLRELLRHAAAPMEEGFMLVFGEQVLHGRIPNVDFLHLYGPLSLDVLAGWYWIADVSTTAERLIGLVQIVAIVAALGVLCRRFGTAAAVAAMVIGSVVSLTAIGLVALAWNGGLALVLWAAVLATSNGSNSRWATRAAGLLWGAALGYRPDLVAAVGLSILATMVWRQPNKLERLKAVAVGMAIGLVPLVIHVGRAGIPAVWRGMFIEPVIELRPGRALPIPPSWSHIDGALQRIAQLGASEWPVAHLSASQQVTVWFVGLVTCVGCYVLGLMWLIRRGDRVSPTLAAMTAISVGVLPQALQRPDTTHLAWAGVVPMACFAAFASATLERCWVPAAQRRIRGVLAAMSIFAVVAVVPTHTVQVWLDLVVDSRHRSDPTTFVRRGERSFALGDRGFTRAAQQVVDELDRRLTPGQSLITAPTDLRRTPYSEAYLYFLFPELRPGTRYIEMDPGIANGPTSELPDELARTDWLILSSARANWSEPNTSVEDGPNTANEVVAAQFCTVGTFGETFTLLAHRSLNQCQ